MWGAKPRSCPSIAAARQEAQSLFELSQDLGASLSLTETLSVFSVKLKPMVPYDAIAIYIKREAELIPEYVNGDNYRLFSSLRIPVGQGLSGWVAHNRKPIINGNPSVEPGEPERSFEVQHVALRAGSAAGGHLGRSSAVLALYRGERDAFTSDHLRILLAVSGKMRSPSRTHLSTSRRKIRRRLTTLRACPTHARFSCNSTANWPAASADNSG